MDITAHKILDDGAVEEMCVSDGGPWGGNSVNREFVELLKKCWGNDFIATLQQAEQTQWAIIERSFEQAKRTPDIKELTQLPLCHVAIPVMKLYEKRMQKDISLTRDNYLYINEEYQLVATKSGINKLFQPSVQHVIDKVGDVLSDKVTHVDYMFIVGGFASSHYLTDSIKGEFCNRSKILIPHDPQLAVLKGAVKFGMNPHIIMTRVMPRTYGTLISYTFDPNIHDADRKYVVENKLRCKVFSKLVTVGQHVNITQEIERHYAPVWSTQKAVRCALFETEQLNAMYPDEPHVTQMPGCLEVPIPDAADGGDRAVQLFVKFGTTEIRARARREDDPHGEWYHTVFEYSPQ